MEKFELPTEQQLFEFANEVISYPLNGGDIDGGTLQELGIKYGLLKMITPDKPCGEDGECHCSEYWDLKDFEKGLATCYRKTFMSKLGIN